MIHATTMDETKAFTILSLPQNATKEDLRTSFRKLCLKYHPDHGGSTQSFCTIKEAYDFLVNNTELPTQEPIQNTTNTEDSTSPNVEFSENYFSENETIDTTRRNTKRNCNPSWENLVSMSDFTVPFNILVDMISLQKKGFVPYREFDVEMTPDILANNYLKCTFEMHAKIVTYKHRWQRLLGARPISKEVKIITGCNTRSFNSLIFKSQLEFSVNSGYHTVFINVNGYQTSFTIDTKDGEQKTKRIRLPIKNVKFDITTKIVTN